MTMTGKPEVWLRGERVEGVPLLLQPVAHSLLQSREELERALSGMTPAAIWDAPAGTASVGFHVLHAIGSLDRLLTYARGAVLSDAQLLVLAQESLADPELTSDDLLAGVDAALERSLDQLRTIDPSVLNDSRLVGRAQLPSTVIGLLFHAAEHTQRHVGQAVTTKILLRRP
jgi:hypothetical protein